MSLSKYRPDIDGLRAIAVLSVVIFHISASWLPNGFLGVDIFFVISGYLITSIIYRDINQGKFSYEDFYLRRIRRILPAFFAVVFFALAMGTLLINIPFLYEELLKSSVAASFFSANLFFMRSGGYFNPNIEDKPLLHIWSLSVEEQFYFVFPIVLIFLLRFEWTRRNKYPILYGLGLVTLAASFIDLNKFGISWDNYYMPHLRVPEMLVGSLLAMLSADNKLSMPRRGGGIALGLLALLGVCFVLPHVFEPPLFPGIAALVPCLATAGLLYLNTEEHAVSKILSLPAVVWVGKISYSLYLWHWVVLAFCRVVYGIGELPMGVIIVATIAMFVLATLSYYFIEQPTRHLNITFKKSLVYLYILPTVLVLAFYKMPKDIIGKQFIPEELTKTDKGKVLFGTTEGDGRLGDLTKPTNVLIAGDSHTGHLGLFFDIVAKHEGWSAFASGAASNPFFFDYVLQFRGDTEEFADKRNKWLSKLYHKYDTVVFSVYWGSKYYKADPKFMPALDKAIERLLREGKKVYLVNSFYKVNSTRQADFSLKRMGIDLGITPEQSRGKPFEEGKATAEAVRKHVAEKFPSVQWIDLTKYIPAELYIDGKPIAADNDHWNGHGATWLAHEFIKHDKLLK